MIGGYRPQPLQKSSYGGMLFRPNRQILGEWLQPTFGHHSHEVAVTEELGTTNAYGYCKPPARRDGGPRSSFGRDRFS